MNVTQLRPGDILRHRGGLLTVTKVQAYEVHGMPRVAVLTVTPREKALCLAFSSRDTVQLVR